MGSNTPGTDWCVGQFFRAVRSRGDCFSITLLKHKPSEEHILLCNVHLYWHPKWPDVKVTQMHVLLQCVQSFIHRQALPKAPRVLILGDFNSIWNKTEQDRYDKVRSICQICLSIIVPVMHQLIRVFHNPADYCYCCPDIRKEPCQWCP